MKFQILAPKVFFLIDQTWVFMNHVAVEKRNKRLLIQKINFMFKKFVLLHFFGSIHRKDAFEPIAVGTRASKSSFVILLFIGTAFLGWFVDSAILIKMFGATKSEDFRLEKQLGVKFKLDTATQFSHNCTALIDQRRWALLNEANNTLYLYNLEDGSISKKIPYATEGPDGVGKLNLSGFLYLNQDSIFIYNYRSQQLFLTNEQGKVKKKYLVRPKNLVKGSAYPSVSNNSQAFFVKPNLIGLIANSHDHQEDHTKLNNLFLFDLSSEKLEFFCPRPQLYNQANWGEQSANYNMHGTYHAWDNAFYYAFPIDNHLYKFDLIRRQSSVVASVKSEYFEKIKPLSKNTNKVFDKLEVDQHVFTNPAYYNLVYDKYRKIYYRFVLHPLSEAQFFAPQGAPIRAVSIICLDEKFQKLGETFIGNENYFLMYFIGENGLYIANKLKYLSNKKIIEFDLFIPAKTATR